MQSESDDDYESDNGDEWMKVPDRCVVIAFYDDIGDLKPNNPSSLCDLEQMLRTIYRKSLYGATCSSALLMKAHTACFQSCESADEAFVYRTILKVLRTERIPSPTDDLNDYFNSSNRDLALTTSRVLLKLGVHRNLWKQIVLHQHEKRKAFYAVLKVCASLNRYWIPNMKNCIYPSPFFWGDQLFHYLNTGV